MTDSFFGLEPQDVLIACEESGFIPTGRVIQLNSYENRVFAVDCEKPQENIVVKFYRPGRWNFDAVFEEAQFLEELAQEGIPVVAPLKPKGKVIHQWKDVWVCFFPKQMGRLPDELLTPDLFQIGQRLAQIHNVGSRGQFKHRPILGESPFSWDDQLDELSKWVVPEIRSRYLKVASEVCDQIEDILSDIPFQRIHGDCHRGNLLARPDSERTKFFFVDFDDCMSGPVAQDFWLLLNGLGNEERDSLIAGYEELRDFPDEQLKLFPWLQAARIMSYSAWIGRRWQDPVFPQLFPQFQTFNFWASEIESLEKILWSKATD